MQSISKIKYSNYKLVNNLKISTRWLPKACLMRQRKNKNKELIYILQHSQETTVADSEN